MWIYLTQSLLPLSLSLSLSLGVCCHFSSLSPRQASLAPNRIETIAAAAAALAADYG